jgi:hypothetical protein
MKYFTAEGSYVWKMDSEHPKRDPECVFDGIPDDWAGVVASVLNETFIEGFEAGVWSPDEPESK